MSAYLLQRKLTADVEHLTKRKLDELYDSVKTGERE
jgi:hypothetical protein